MKNRVGRTVGVAAGAMLAAPFLLLAARYDALPSALAVLRGPGTGAVMMAQKSPFTVFRVPLMNLTHGLMAAVMLTCGAQFVEARRRLAFCRVFLALLFTVALKSDLEALEMGSFGAAHWLTVGTVASVVCGLALALAFSRGVPLPWPEWKVGGIRGAALLALLAIYIGLVVSLPFVGRRI